MPIDKISDIRWLPRLGKIRLGVKKEGQRGPYPQAVDYFVCPEEVKSVYGETPRELDVMFPSDDLGLVAPQWYKCYSYSQGLLCKGDGKLCKRKVDTDTGNFANRDTREWILTDGICEPEHCPMVDSKQCRKMMTLLFILPEIPGLGVYQLDTSSFYSIVNMNSQLAPDGFIRPFTKGKIAFIPLKLSIGPQEVTPPGVSRKTVHILKLRADVKLADIIRISRQSPARVLLPTLEEEEPPDDLFPEELLVEAEDRGIQEEEEVPGQPGRGGASLIIRPEGDDKSGESAAQRTEEAAAQDKADETSLSSHEGEERISKIARDVPADSAEVSADRQRIIDSAARLGYTEKNKKLTSYLQDRCKDKSITSVDQVPAEKVHQLANELSDWETMS